MKNNIYTSLFSKQSQQLGCDGIVGQRTHFQDTSVIIGTYSEQAAEV